MAGSLSLPLVDLSSPDPAGTAKSIRQACLDYGFFYLINHGIEVEVFKKLFSESKRFFSLPLEEKMKLEHGKDHTGYTHLFSEIHDTSSEIKGDMKESFYIGPTDHSNSHKNQWPSEGILPHWRAPMESFQEKVLNVSKRLLSLIALALNLEEQFFEKVGAFPLMPFIRLLHYPGGLDASQKGRCGASAHSDYGMLTLLVTDGVPGLQICREKDHQPQLWEDVHHVDGAFIVNVGDMLERWTNCLFRSTLHRVQRVGQERYSVALFLDANFDCLVECLETCCSEISPPRFPPVRSGDYLQERLRATYSSY